MDKKYTTITITKELSKRIRQYALSNDLKTEEAIKMAFDRIEADDLLTLYEQIDKDLGNKPRTYTPPKEKPSKAQK
jgi:hypothetical protein